MAHLRHLAVGLQRRLRPRPLRPPTVPELTPLQPHRRRRRSPGSGLQHGGELRHQHELAELRRREHHEPPHPDGGPGRAELRLRRRRAGRRHRLHPRPGPPSVRHHRQLLGRPGPGHRPRPAPDRLRRRHRARQPGRRAEPRWLRARDHRRGRRPGDPRWSAGQPGGHQGARDQRRRVPQRQLGASLRQPQRLHRPLRDLPPPAHPILPDCHLRSDGRRPAPGPRRPRRHAGPVARRGRAGHGLRGERQPRAGRSRRHPDGGRRPGGRQPGGKGGSLRARGVRLVRSIHDRNVDGRGQLGPRQLHPGGWRRPPGEHHAGRGQPGRGGGRDSTGC